MMPQYLTDAEKQTRMKIHGVCVQEYRFFLRFELKRKTFTRWFRSVEDRASFKELLAQHEAVIVHQGETP